MRKFNFRKLLVIFISFEMLNWLLMGFAVVDITVSDTDKSIKSDPTFIVLVTFLTLFALCGLCSLALHIRRGRVTFKHSYQNDNLLDDQWADSEKTDNEPHIPVLLHIGNYLFGLLNAGVTISTAFTLPQFSQIFGQPDLNRSGLILIDFTLLALTSFTIFIFVVIGGFVRYIKHG
ncbi:hypothetical protein GC194_14125 [bacterium]|nr:hypothetical protein [bacterium]